MQLGTLKLIAICVLSAMLPTSLPWRHSVLAQAITSEPVRIFDPTAVVLKDSDPVNQAKRALAAHQPEKVAVLLADPSKVSSDPLAQGRWYWLLAKAALAQAKWSTAAQWFNTLANTHHPLSMHARLEYAKLLLNNDPLSAAMIASQLSGLSPGGYEAKALEIKALAKANVFQDALKRTEVLLAETAPSTAGATFLLPLADALATQPNTEYKKIALSYYRRIASRLPLQKIGKDAKSKAELVLSQLSASDQEQLNAWSEDDSFAYALALFNAREYEQAEAYYAELTTRFRDAPYCQARFMQARAMLQRKSRKDGAPLMKRVAEECATPAIRPRAFFLAAEAYANMDEHGQARILYAKLEREFPSHRLADDARYRSALLLRLDKKEALAAQLLKSLPYRYPHGDMRHEAHFTLAWQAYSRRNYAMAKVYLEKLIKEQPQESSEEGLHGRGYYWLARVLEKLHQRKQATDRYLELLRRWPMTYYAQLAWERAARLDRTSTQKIANFLSSSAEPSLQFTWKHFMDSNDFQRLLEWFRVGEYDLANTEIKTFLSNTQNLDREDCWLIAALLSHAGKQPEAIQVLRTHLKDLWSYPPVGKELTRWRLAYPLAYQPLIETEATKQGVPPSLVRAIAREESSFDPNAVSVARAYGLIQLIPSTAKTHATPLRLPYDPMSLKNPEINLPIGIHFLRFLKDRYYNNVAFIPAAYNAGETAVDRWLREYNRHEVDEWIENIPYSQTRRYSRRVLQTYGIYHWLATRQLPGMWPHWPSTIQHH